MQSAERYGEQLFAAVGEDELDRLRALSAAFDQASHDALTAFGPLDGWTCLDVGAGSGTISGWLGERVGAAGQVVACDRDTRLLDTQPHERVRVVTADITDADVQLGSFDLVHARFVLMHLRDRHYLVSRLASWVRPGGVLVLSDAADLGTRVSHQAAYRQTMAALWRFLADTIGTDIDYGLRHRAAYGALGLSNVTMRVDLPTVSAGSPLSVFWTLTLKQALPRMISGGYVPAEAAQQALSYLDSGELCDLSIAMITTSGRVPG